MLIRLRVVALFATAAAGSNGDTKHGREVIRPADSAEYQYTNAGGLKVPTILTAKYTVKCLVYQDAARPYIEIGIENRASTELELSTDLVSMEQIGKPIPRIDTIKAAEQVDAAAVRPFVPKPSGEGPATRRPVYPRDEVDRQAKEHIAMQERENAFAGLLVALAREHAPAVLRPGEERTIICTFEQEKDKSKGYDVMVRLGGDTFRFGFKE